MFSIHILLRRKCTYSIYEWIGARTCANELRSFLQKCRFYRCPPWFCQGLYQRICLWTVDPPQSPKDVTALNSMVLCYIRQQQRGGILPKEKHSWVRTGGLHEQPKPSISCLASVYYSRSGGVNVLYIWLKTPDKMRLGVLWLFSWKVITVGTPKVQDLGVLMVRDSSVFTVMGTHRIWSS